MTRSDSTRRWGFLLVAWLLISGTLAGLFTSPTIQSKALTVARLLISWDLQLGDRLVNTLSSPPAGEEFVFLGIDDKSMELDLEDPEIVSKSRPLSLMAEQFPWSREVWAHALERLLESGARLVVLDILLPAPRKADDGDRKLQAVIERYPDRIVLASNLAAPDSSQGIIGLGKILEPTEAILPDWEKPQPRIGFATFWPDLDGVVRRIRYHETLEAIASLPDSPDSEVFPALSAAMLEGMDEELPAFAKRGAFRFQMAEGLNARWNPHPVYEIFWPSLWERNYGSGDFFRDKVVLIGPSSPHFQDVHSTPAGDVLGPQLHLNAVHAARHSALLRDVSPPTNALLIVFLGLLAVLIVGKLQRPGTALVLLLATAFLYLIGLRLLLEEGYLGGVLGPLASLLLVGSTGLAFDHARVYRERQLLRRALERRVSSEVMEEILANPSSYLNQLGGVRKHVTVLFSDLRGFTSLSESASPEEMVTRLNAYFDLMVGEIQEERGMVDKFIGDAIMAIWGSVPSLPSESGVKQAVAASLGMIRRLKELNDRWEREHQDQPAPNWAMGIGIHCGEAITGNIGSEKRLELTVIGDAVNLASRLEGTTKRYGVSLIISDAAATHLLNEDGWVLRPIDRVRVSGRKTPVSLYEPLAAPENGSETTEADPDSLIAHAPAFVEAFELYQRRDFAEAAERYDTLLQFFPDDVTTKMLAERCREFIAAPPPEDWQGAISLTSK